ncbi:MAG: response regulator [Treponema sp.]|nr:response regulator [Treponema sp.]
MAYDRNENGLRSDGSKGHVLIADDAPFIIKQLTAMLTKEGYTVIGTAQNGQEALKIYQEKYPDIDLVTLDITMPVLDGITTLERILAYDKNAHVVMVTANGNESLVKKAITLGAKNYIVKPIVAEKALPRLEGAMRK